MVITHYGKPIVWYCGWTVSCREYQRIGWWRLPIAVNSDHVYICSGLAAILNRMFKAISGHILQMVRDTA